MRIAVDIGFGFVKVMNEFGVKESFPSVMAKRPENTLRGIVGGAGDDYSVEYNESVNTGNKGTALKLYVGDAGITNGGTRKWEDKDHFNVEELKIFIATAVGLVNPDNAAVDVCVGLPMSYYLQKKDELIKILENVSAEITYEGVKGTRKIKFKSVFCFPQGAGAYYSAVCDIDGKIKDYNLATTSVGVIDIGYRTVDFLVMGKGRKGITMLDGMSGSLEEDGMIKAFQKIEKSISEKIGREVGLSEIEKTILWFGGKLDFRREQINITPYEENAYKELAENIAAKIKQKWGVEADFLSVVLVTGGGGEALYPILKEKFILAELQENSAFANCGGYLGVQAKKMERR